MKEEKRNACKEKKIPQIRDKGSLIWVEMGEIKMGRGY